MLRARGAGSCGHTGGCGHAGRGLPGTGKPEGLAKHAQCEGPWALHCNQFACQHAGLNSPLKVCPQTTRSLSSRGCQGPRPCLCGPSGLSPASSPAPPADGPDPGSARPGPAALHARRARSPARPRPPDRGPPSRRVRAPGRPQSRGAALHTLAPRSSPMNCDGTGPADPAAAISHLPPPRRAHLPGMRPSTPPPARTC